jgi:Skp family chaperone for outer membrane proteins
VIEKTGEEEGYTFIIEKGTVPYSNNNIDITDLIIKKYNETETTKKKS